MYEYDEVIHIEEAAERERERFVDEINQLKSQLAAQREIVVAAEKLSLAIDETFAAESAIASARRSVNLAASEVKRARKAAEQVDKEPNDAT